jgi:hypothetical protein
MSPESVPKSLLDRHVEMQSLTKRVFKPVSGTQAVGRSIEALSRKEVPNCEPTPHLAEPVSGSVGTVN